MKFPGSHRYHAFRGARKARKHLPLAALLLASGALVPAAHAQKLYSENFDTVPLGPNPEEASKGAAVWTKTPPTGWVIDDTGMPGYGTPDYAANDGRTEWAGWSFADARWWPTVDNQRRAEFLLATGAAAIADPDEWDDAGHLKGLFNSYLTTPDIDVAGKAANSLVLAFDSSWRPEGHDDGGTNWPLDENGEPLNNQTAVITAQWDNGTPVEILKWESYPNDGPNYHPDAVNESVVVELKNPGGAQKLKVKFGLVLGANDWWWAFDNMAVGVPPLVTGASATGVGFTVRLREALGKTVNEGAALTVKLDGATVAATKSRDADVAELILLAADQSPKIFTPRSTHNVEVTFTTSDGRTVTDSAQFVAPGYATATATPTAVVAGIAENSYLTVDETKGVKVELDGVAVSNPTVKRVDLTATDGSDLPDRIDVTVTPAAAFDSGSAHVLKLTYTTKTAQEVVETVNFAAPTYVTIPGALGTATGTGADAGIRWKTYQLEAARPADNLANVEKQLAGELGADVHDTAGQTAQGYFDVSVVNFEQDGVDAGNFNASSTVDGQGVGDALIPGIPGTTGSTDNIAAEALAYVEIPAAGVYQMVVNSDDGFQVSVGNATNPKYQVLGQFDAGRGAADTAFYFKAEKAGVYLFRLVYFEGGGGASVEWFTVNASGTRALVNGTQTGALKSFKRRTVAEPEIPTAGGNVSKIALTGGQVKIEYTGTLQSADAITGPFTPVAGAASPYSVAPSGAQKFYIAK